MERKPLIILVAFLITMLACNTLLSPNSNAHPAKTPFSTPNWTSSAGTTIPNDSLNQPTDAGIPALTIPAQTDNKCDSKNWKIAITGVDEEELGNGRKNVFVRIGVENNDSVWGYISGPDNDEDTETQKSVFITTKDGSTYGYLSNMSVIQPRIVLGPNLTQNEAVGRVETALIPPGFSILGQTVLGEPHYYGFAFQLPNTQVPDTVTIRNMSMGCMLPPIVDGNGNPSYGGGGDAIPSKSYNLNTDIEDVHALPSADKLPNLVGSKLELPDGEGFIEFTKVTRNGNTVEVIFDYINYSTYEAYVSFQGYIIGASLLSSCQTSDEHDCEISASYMAPVQPGQTVQGLIWSFTVPENETNLMFAYVYGDVVNVDEIYKITP